MFPMITRVLEWAELSSAAGTDNDNALTTPANKAPSTAQPATDESAGRFVLQTAGPDASGAIGQAVHYGLLFISQSAADQTYGVRLWGWRKLGTLYVPHLLGELSLTAGARVGIAGATIDDTWYFPDAIIVDDDNTRGESVEAHVSGTDGTSHVTFDATGFQYVEAEVSCESSAAAVRAFYTAL